MKIAEIKTLVITFEGKVEQDEISDFRDFIEMAYTNIKNNNADRYTHADKIVIKLAQTLGIIKL